MPSDKTPIAPRSWFNQDRRKGRYQKLRQCVFHLHHEVSECNRAVVRLLNELRTSPRFSIRQTIEPLIL